MNKIRSFVNVTCQIAITVGIVISVWKIARFWRPGLAEKAGRDIDASVSAATKNLEETAKAIGLQADSGLGESLGIGIDEVLTDTKKKLDKATDLVQRALKHNK
jgi:hypothetical protein